MSTGVELWQSSVGINERYADLKCRLSQVGIKVVIEFLCDDGEWRGRVIPIDKTEYDRGDVPIKVAE